MTRSPRGFLSDLVFYHPVSLTQFTSVALVILPLLQHSRNFLLQSLSTSCISPWNVLPSDSHVAFSQCLHVSCLGRPADHPVQKSPPLLSHCLQHLNLLTLLHFFISFHFSSISHFLTNCNMFLFLKNIMCETEQNTEACSKIMTGHK